MACWRVLTTPSFYRMATLKNTSSSALAKAKALCYLRSGMDSFREGKYGEAKCYFLEGQKFGEEKMFKEWLTWCDKAKNNILEGKKFGRKKAINE